MIERFVAISGGVGGAKLALGLARTLDSGQLLVVVNTGDDFEHLGLSICPDLDTLMYTLAGCADPERGWGLANETWQCIDAIERLGGPGWFRLGDRDLATHLQRTALLQGGMTLSLATHALSQRMGNPVSLVPMSDAPVRTRLDTDRGELAFQEYFVRERCEPVVANIRFDGAASARPAPLLAEWLSGSDVGVVICPSNPYLSVDPVLAVPGVAEQLQRRPVVAVSPIVGGQAIKGPAAKIMRELGLPATVEQIARHYRGIVDALVIDACDAAEAASVRALGLEVIVTQTVMRNLADKQRLARQLVDWLRQRAG